MLIDPHKAYSLHEKGQLCEHYCITACLLGFTFADSNNWTGPKLITKFVHLRSKCWTPIQLYSYTIKVEVSKLRFAICESVTSWWICPSFVYSLWFSLIMFLLISIKLLRPFSQIWGKAFIFLQCETASPAVQKCEFLRILISWGNCLLSKPWKLVSYFLCHRGKLIPIREVF